MRCSPLPLSLLLLLGCTDRPAETGSPEPPRGMLVDHALWSTVDLSEDPFDDGLAAEDVTCPSTSWTVEVGAPPPLELDSGACNYLLLRQPSLRAVEPGEVIRVELGHAALYADTAAEAHAEIRLGDLVLWDTREEIPCQAAFDVALTTATAPIPAGTPVWVHIHNHGDNTWNVYTVDAGEEGAL